MSKFTNKAENVLNKSLILAKEFGHTYVGSEHLLLALTSEADSVACKILSGRAVSFNDVHREIEERVGTGERTQITAADMTPRTKRIIESSAEQAARFGQSYIGTEHLLLALTREGESIAVSIFNSLGTSGTEISNDVTKFLEELEGITDINKQSRGSTLRDAPTLSKSGRDLTAMARQGKLDCVIGRDAETERMIQILSRRTKNNPCLVGEPGVGKTAVVEGLAARIAGGTVPETLADKLIISLDLTGMVAGAKYRGEFEERMKNVMAEVKKNPHVILFIDEIHTLIGAGAAEGAVDAANILKPALARGELRLIGATTTAEYRKYIEKDAALERRFASVAVGEPTPEETIRILKGLRERYESHHKVKITDEAIEAAVRLSVRYIGDRFLPDKAIDLMDEAASKARIALYTYPSELTDRENELKEVRQDKEEAIRGQDFERAAAFRDREREIFSDYEEEKRKWRNSLEEQSLSINSEDIADVVTAWTGIPVRRLESEESDRLARLGELLRERIIGQDKAAEAVAKAIRRGRMGLRDPERPIGSFIFLGPTGVGKTELCRVLAELLFGDRNCMIRIDMSELMERHTVSKLVGSPPGYVGYGEGGQLTEKIRRKPYSVVLFDEIEKAHPDVLNLLLQILEDGHLTDSEGRCADFRNAVIIMTSNIGARELTEKRRPLGFSSDAAKNTDSAVMAILRESFRPEFLNRIDEIIIFNSLGAEDTEKITELMLSKVSERINSLGIEIHFSPEVVKTVAKEGFDPVYGARPIRRVIKSRIEDSLAAALIDGSVSAGCEVTAELGDGGEIIYRKNDASI